MKAASLSEIKEQLKERSKQEVTDICLRLARYKKENKELIDFLLFHSNDQEGYIQSVKEEIDDNFRQVNTTNIYFAKKTLRKVLRLANKHIRYTGNKTAEVEILMHYLTNFRGIKLPWQKTKATRNIYDAQLKKVRAAIETMHEDLQYDYKRELERLLVH
jgi:prophage maintenance system killer protein